MAAQNLSTNQGTKNYSLTSFIHKILLPNYQELFVWSNLGIKCNAVKLSLHIFYFRYWSMPASFRSILFFSYQNWNKRICCAWDLNPRPKNGRNKRPRLYPIIFVGWKVKSFKIRKAKKNWRHFQFRYFGRTFCNNWKSSSFELKWPYRRKLCPNNILLRKVICLKKYI